MSECYVVGRKVRLETNGHEYIAEPFIVFRTKQQADEACGLVEKVSGERPMVVEASLYTSIRPEKEDTQ